MEGPQGGVSVPQLFLLGNMGQRGWVPGDPEGVILQ